MTARTRNFVITSLVVLTAGLGTGLVAYYGLPTGVFAGAQQGPSELQFIPRDAAVVAFANVQDVMQSEVRQKLLKVLPGSGQGQDEFEQHTGINIDTDIDRVVACLSPSTPGGAGGPGSEYRGPAGLVLARGRFDAVRIESLMREHGGQVETYKNVRMIIAPAGNGPTASVAFLEPGLAALGSAHLVRNAVDLKSGGSNVTDNAEMMEIVRTIDDGNAWAVGRFDALNAQLPPEVSQRIPAITWFSANGFINGGVSGTVRVEAKDEESATNLREVLRGIVALAKMELGSQPAVQTLTRSLELGGTGTTVSLSFEIPAELLDVLGNAARQEPIAVPQ
jgi:hypothetical protein